VTLPTTPTSYSDFYNAQLNGSTGICNGVNAAACASFRSAYTVVTSLGAGGAACMIIGFFLSLTSFVFTALASYNKNKKIEPPSGTCAARVSVAAASVVPEWFAFVVRQEIPSPQFDARF
jgi:hypothetical protein